METFIGLLIPFLGTTLGAACVFFLKKELNDRLQKTLLGFASGVMVAASVWSLLIPAIEQSSAMGKLAFLPAVIGFGFGIAFLLLLDMTIPHVHLDDEQEGPESSLSKTMMMVLAVVIHNIPEGMAVGVVYAGYLTGNSGISLSGAFALALGIAIQNFPEGAIISMPLHSQGLPILPYLLSLAAGAMLYVVVEELIPEMSQGKHSNIGTVFFALGFMVMMTLDVALG